MHLGHKTLLSQVKLLARRANSPMIRFARENLSLIGGMGVDGLRQNARAVRARTRDERQREAVRHHVQNLGGNPRGKSAERPYLPISRKKAFKPVAQKTPMSLNKIFLGPDIDGAAWIDAELVYRIELMRKIDAGQYTGLCQIFYIIEIVKFAANGNV